MTIALIGCHRSGTSMMSNLFFSLGLNIGSEEGILMVPTSANKKGHWENKEVVKINDGIISHFGGKWYRPVPFPENWPKNSELDGLYSRGQALLKDCGDSFFFKDPRTSICLPFWQQLDPELQLVVALRHPTDVVQSLKNRDNSPVDTALGYFLWVEYYRRILEDGHQNISCVSFYDNYFSNPNEETNMIISQLGLTTSKDTIRKALDEVVSPQLRRNQHESRVVDAPHPSIGNFYSLLMEIHKSQFKDDPESFKNAISTTLDFIKNDPGFREYLNNSRSLLTRSFGGMGLKIGLQHKLQRNIKKLKRFFSRFNKNVSN